MPRSPLCQDQHDSGRCETHARRDNSTMYGSRVPGLREGSRSWAGGARHGITCVWTGYRRVLAGRKVRTAIRQLLTQCQTAAEPTDSTPNVVTCHVTVISWLDRERHAPFLIRNREKRRHGFLMSRFLNAREQLYSTIQRYLAISCDLVPILPDIQPLLTVTDR